MTKGDGEFPSADDFSENEKNDIRTCLTLSLNWDESEISIDDVKITAIEFVYDGISHYGEEDFGYWFDDYDDLNGYPAPIINFTLNKIVNQNEFLKAIWTSTMILKTESMEDDFYAEDHNGYTTILDDKQLESWIEQLRYFSIIDLDADKTKIIFSDGLPSDGYRLSALKFALDPNKD